MQIKETYHPGEIAVQEMAGVRDMAERLAGIVSGQIVAGAQYFISQQSMVVVGSVSPEAQTWASVLFGDVGMARADGQMVTFHLERMIQRDADPFWANIENDPRVGMLFIDPATRRRFRANGTVSGQSETELVVSVSEAYANCQKFIRRRDRPDRDLATSDAPAPVIQGQAFEARVRSLIENSDTAFVASAHPDRGVDASHRGGPPGFMKVLDDRTLRVPDYSGNGMFNTLGNISVNPNTGLVLIDYERGDVLQIAGHVELRFDVEDISGETGGTGRFWDLSVERWILAVGAAPSNWKIAGSAA